MKLATLSIFTALSLSVPAIAVAGHGGNACPMDKKDCSHTRHDCSHTRHHNIETMDANTDGKVSFNEFKKAHDTSHLKKRFESKDINGDGFISDDDKQARHQNHMNKRFNATDSNKDGVLSKDEFAATKEHHNNKPKHCKY